MLLTILMILAQMPMAQLITVLTRLRWQLRQLLNSSTAEALNNNYDSGALGGEYLFTPLLVAVKENNVEAIRLLLAGRAAATEGLGTLPTNCPGVVKGGGAHLAKEILVEGEQIMRTARAATAGWG